METQRKRDREELKKKIKKQEVINEGERVERNENGVRQASMGKGTETIRNGGT